MANEVVIHVREEGTAQTQASLKGLGVSGVAVGAAIGTAMAGMAVKAASAFSELAKSSVDAASSMAESLSKTRVVFGQASSGIESFAKDAASNLGLSNQAALEMAGTFGNLFTAMGITRPQAADMSKSILQLGSDLASFNNIPVEEALLKIRAGLVGESEPLRTLGVNLNEAMIQAEGLRLGLMKQGETLTASGKAQAAYSLIMDQTKNAQGDFARTSEGLANQQKKLTAVFDDLKAKIGTALLPVVTDITTKLADLIAKNGEEWAKNFASGVDTAAKAAGALFDVLDKLVKSSPFQFTVKMIQEATGTDTGNPLARAAVLPLALWADAGKNASGVMGAMPQGLQQMIMGTEWARAHGPGQSTLDQLTREGIIKHTPGLGGGGEFEESVPNSILAGLTPGGGGGGPTSTQKTGGGKSALESAWEHINDTLLNELIAGGEKKLDATKEEQAKLLEETTTTAQRMATILGVDLSKTLIPAFESIRDREKELADQRIKAAADAWEVNKKLLEAEHELYEQRRQEAFSLTKAAFGAGLGANTRDNNGNLFFGGSGSPESAGANYGVINQVFPNVGGGSIAVPSTADGMP